jgi:hypothetical protein
MSNVHIEFIEDTNGDVEDILYYHHSCAPEDVKGWPCPEAVDSPVYCARCRRRIHEVPLTEWGEREYEESRNFRLASRSH